MNISEIVKEGKQLAEIENPPTLKIMKELNNIVKEFLEKKELIIYGGTAITALLNQKEIQISDPELLIDYDFYSPDYDKDSKELSDLIYEKKYKYVRRINAIHPNTFRIGAEFSKDFIADITYFPPEYFAILQNNSPKIDNLRYTDPQFLKIDLYLSITRPHTNVFRWEKSYKRLYYLEKYYPLISRDSERISSRDSERISSKKFERIISEIKKPIIIYIGISAYNKYMEKNKIPEEYIEIYTLDSSEVIKQITKKCPEIEVREVENFIDILPKRKEIYYNFEKKVIIYDIGYDCISYHKNVSNFHYLLWYLYAFRYIEGIFKNNSRICNLYTKMIIDLQNLSNQIMFDTNCLSLDPSEALLRAPKKMFYGYKQPPNYRPDKKKIEKPEN